MASDRRACPSNETLLSCRDMEPVGPPDIHHLSAAVGWMELGNHAEAKLELAKVAPALAEHPDVLEATWAIHASEKNWTEALRAAEKIVAADPNRATGWLHRAYACRRAP